MNKNFKSTLAIAIGTLFAASAFAAQPTNTSQPTATGAGSISLNSNIGGNFNINQAGFSASQAGNSQSASATVMSGVTKTPNYSSVTANTAGSTATNSDAYAINQSSGGGMGFAQSTGAVQASTNGAAKIDGIASAIGASNAGTNDQVTAFTNQGGENASSTTSTFSDSLAYSTTHGTTIAPTGGQVVNGVNLSSDVTGTAGGSNQTWNGYELGINGIGFASVNQVQSSGSFAGSATGAASVSSSASYQIPTIHIGPITIPVGPEALSLN